MAARKLPPMRRRARARSQRTTPASQAHAAREQRQPTQMCLFLRYGLQHKGPRILPPPKM
jgi:hypothetical protein